jgi:hypothetical membrane protein
MRGDAATRLGALAWASSVQFFVMQAVVQSAWTTPYSLKENYISDLGNTSCGPSEVGTNFLYVCSPWHAAMNASFVVFGVGILVGCALLGGRHPLADASGSEPEPRALGTARVSERVPRASATWLAGLALVAVAGVGAILVGVFPEDLNFPFHKLGAAMQFIVGNAGLVVAGTAIQRARRMPALAWAATALGATGLTATALFVERVFLGLGIGGIERVAAYALPIWLIAAGISFMPSARGGST